MMPFALPPIHFPEIKSFSELFDEAYSSKIASKEVARHGRLRYVTFTHDWQRIGLVGFYGVLKPKFEAFIKEQMDSIVPDPNIFVSVAVRDDGSCLVTFSYNQIIGSRWICVVGTNGVDDFVRFQIKSEIK